MKSIQLGNCKLHCALILFSLLILLFNYKLFNKTNHFTKNTNLTETRSKTTKNIFKNIETLQILNNFENKNGTNLTRTKRLIMFDGGGVVKLVIGTSYPIIMADKLRSLSYFYNLQMQYVPPPIPLYPWSIYNTSTFPARSYKKQKRSTQILLPQDKSRSLLYKFIERFIQKSGYSGRKCLLRIICEMAHSPLEEASEIIQLKEDYGRYIYHTLINAIFIPTYSNVHERYIKARNVGRKGFNCSKIFGECYIAEQFFKQFTLFI